MGWPEGWPVGLKDGVGAAVGLTVGTPKGVGPTVGNLLGCRLGVGVGEKLHPGGRVGVAVGDREGMFVAKLRSSVSLRVNRGRKICTISSDRSVHVAVKLTVIASGTFTVFVENPTEPSMKASLRHTKQSNTTRRSSAVVAITALSVIKQGSFPFHGNK